ncbi:MAG TPA: DUF4167 domain-containing protein [Stellaceae bacterium]|nr:DUF4167 domain-containing protein [Stellaceae bacterium]
MGVRWTYAQNALLDIVKGTKNAPIGLGSDSAHPDQAGVMRPGPNKRSRGRNNGNNPHHNRPRMPHRIQTFDSNGPNVKIRGNAYQVFERYVALAREAAASGDRIAAENLYQHAEHYFRVMNANGDANQHGAPRPMTPADIEMGDTEPGRDDGDDDAVQPSLPIVPSEDQSSRY